MIKAIIGLGNPGRQFYFTRHNIGFRVLDTLAESLGLNWRSIEPPMEITSSIHNNHEVYLIKPQTYMNSSGRIIPYLQKKGVKCEEVLVIHDELELPFGKVAYKFDGSAKGHNGLKSLIEAFGPNFGRIRCGIGRPENRKDVPDYVLETFREDSESVENMIKSAIALINEQINERE